MRPKDITSRVLRRPLHSPYGGAPHRPWLRWALLAISAWLLYAAVFSDHSLWRIAQLRHELSATDAEVTKLQDETRRLEGQVNDPQLKAEHAEQVLRRQGFARTNEIIYRLGGTADSTAN